MLNSIYEMLHAYHGANLGTLEQVNRKLHSSNERDEQDNFMNIPDGGMLIQSTTRHLVFQEVDRGNQGGQEGEVATFISVIVTIVLTILLLSSKLMRDGRWFKAPETYVCA